MKILCGCGAEMKYTGQEKYEGLKNLKNTFSIYYIFECEACGTVSIKWVDKYSKRAL